jgi:hypothetical protein
MSQRYLFRCFCKIVKSDYYVVRMEYVGSHWTDFH